MSTATDYAKTRPIDWSWWTDVATLTLVLFACGVVW